MARHLMTVFKKDIRKWSYSWKGTKNQDKLTVNECACALSNSGLSRTSTENCRDAWARLVLLLSGVCMWPFAWERGKLSIHRTLLSLESSLLTDHLVILFYFRLDLILLATVAISEHQITSKAVPGSLEGVSYCRCVKIESVWSLINCKKSWENSGNLWRYWLLFTESLLSLNRKTTCGLNLRIIYAVYYIVANLWGSVYVSQSRIRKS